MASKTAPSPYDPHLGRVFLGMMFQHEFEHDGHIPGSQFADYPEICATECEQHLQDLRRRGFAVCDKIAPTAPFRWWLTLRGQEVSAGVWKRLEEVVFG